MRTSALLLLACLAASGCKKKAAPVAAAAPAADNQGVVAPGGVVAEQPMVAGGGGGGGAVQAVRGAVQRVVTQAELKSIQLFIDTASAASGRMPSTAETLAAIRQSDAKLAGLIDDGTIVLHPATVREAVWAYEAKALSAGGLVLTNSGVERMDAAALRQRLGR
jgi:hypothetical protein